MEILFIFSKKVSSPNRDSALKIADRNKNFLDENGMYKVIFNSFNQDFLKLLNLCGCWTSAELYIDEEQIDLLKLRNILLCDNKDTCNGLCDRIKIPGFYSINNLVETIMAVDKGEYWGVDRLKIELEDSEFFIRGKGDSYSINKDKLKEEILGQLDLPLKFCNKIKKDLILKKIGSLPNNFTMKPRVDRFSNNGAEENENLQGFNGFSDEEIAKMTAKAEIEAPILAEAIAKELKKILKL